MEPQIVPAMYRNQAPFTTLGHSPAGLRGLKIDASAELRASIGR